MIVSAGPLLVSAGPLLGTGSAAYVRGYRMSGASKSPTKYLELLKICLYLLHVNAVYVYVYVYLLVASVLKVNE